MTRVKRGVTAHRKREKVLKQTKGFRWRRKTNERAAKEALLHAYTHAFRGRKQRKRDFRSLWQVKINAAVRQHGSTYSKFINDLKKGNIELNRKMLADLAVNDPKVFNKILAEVSAK
jgi:large subunit ribosomal protein L20